MGERFLLGKDHGQKEVVHCARSPEEVSRSLVGGDSCGQSCGQVGVGRVQDCSGKQVTRGRIGQSSLVVKLLAAVAQSAHKLKCSFRQLHIVSLWRRLRHPRRSIENVCGFDILNPWHCD